tara:strand:- start:1359 stop:1811 length:453 start_codon:yes stop_codon:yes gene_type:complete
MFNKIKSFIKPKKIKVKVKPSRKVITKNIGGGKKIVSSKPKPRRQTGGKRGPTKTEKAALVVGGAGALTTLTINKMLRDRRDARADEGKTSATPKRKPKKQGMSEKGRGRGAKPSKIVTDKKGKAVRDKRGNAVNFGGANKGGKKSREGR